MKIKEKIKKGKDKVVDWCVDHAEDITTGLLCIGTGAITAMFGYAVGVGSGLKSGRTYGAAHLEEYIRENVPEASKLIDDHFDEVCKELTEVKK